MFRPFLAAAAMLAAAPALTPALAEEVNVYSSRQPQLIQPIFDAFTAATGIGVRVLFAEKGLVERMRIEGANSPADVYVTAEFGDLMAAVQAGLTRPVASAALEAALPATLRDPDGRWFGVTTRARVVYASKDRVAPGEIGAYEDLADPKWRGRICTRSGRHPYNLALTAAMIAHRGEAETRAWLQGLKANLARRPQGNDRSQVKAIWAGECDIAIGNTYYMGKMLQDPEQAEWANSVRIEFPVFEGGGVHVNVSAMAMTASAPNPAEALALMEFMVSEEAQRLYAGLNYEYPARPGVPAAALVAGWGDFTPDTIGLTEIAANRGAALRLVDEVGFDD